jgi:hypothetical protein
MDKHDGRIPLMLVVEDADYARALALLANETRRAA